MCGIAGLVCARAACRDEDHARLVEAMTALQAHRGPDHAGVVGLGAVWLGANRLSIIDLSPAGHMPMATEDGRWWIAYNGEVYNFAGLRADLARAGHRFRSRTDTEVVLRAFQTWGEACLTRFVGMFAVALYDRRTDTLTLARDRFGKKPLYHASVGGHLLFASELKALRPGLGPRRVDRQRLLEWMLYRTVDGGADTLLEGVRALPAGHLMRVVRGRPEPPRSFYRLEAEVHADAWRRWREAPAPVVADTVEAAIAQGVHDRLVSDVPMGTLLSGGVDSSLVTALAARGRPGLTAFNIAVEGHPALDEHRYARAAATALGVELRTLPLTGEAYRHALVRAVYHSDLPLTHPNSVAYLLVSEFARAHGCVILLTGEGADELFGGYPQRYRRRAQLLRLERLLARAPGRLRKALVLVGGTAAGLPVTRFSEYDLLAHAVGALDGWAREGHLRRCEAAYAFVPDPVERAVLATMLGDVHLFLPALLRRLDRMSMAASVECRAPYLDHRLVGLVVNLPLRWRLRGRTDKWLLRQVAARHLPRALVTRRKVGFPLPVADYLAPLARPELFRDGFCVADLGMDPAGLAATVEDGRHRIDAVFSLLTLEIWGRLFVRDEALDAVTALVLGRSTTAPVPGPAVPPVAAAGAR